MSDEPLWPAEWKLHADHCGDVLRGSYDVPFYPVVPPILIDLGANVGAFARWAKTRWEGCEIHCYEPNEQLQEKLLWTIDHYDIAAQTHQCAVSDHDGEATFSEGPNNCGEGSIALKYGTKEQTVKVISAARLPEGDVLKIDTEGCELPILTRLAEVGRLKDFSAVMLETHSPSDRETIMALLPRHGFTLTKDHVWSRAGGMKYRDPVRSELCYVRTDLLPEDFKPVVTDSTPPKPLIWIATPFKHKVCEEGGQLTKEDIAALDPDYRDPIIRLHLAENLPWRFNLCVVGGGSIPRARNKIISMALIAPDPPEVILFQDYDLRPTEQDYVTLLSHLYESGALVVGGGYTTREKNGHWVYNYEDRRGVQHGWGLIVGEIGTGFKAIHMKAIQAVIAKNEWLKCEDDDTHDSFYAFFCIAPAKDEKLWPGKNRWLSEDYWLDWLMRDCNIPTVWDTTVKIRHRDGEHLYPALDEDFPPLPEADLTKELAKT